jgi:hypothetical protein
VNPEGFANTRATMPTLPAELRCCATDRNNACVEACREHAGTVLDATREQAATEAVGLRVRMANILANANATAPVMVQT